MGVPSYGPGDWARFLVEVLDYPLSMNIIGWRPPDDVLELLPQALSDDDFRRVGGRADLDDYRLMVEDALAEADA